MKRPTLQGVVKMTVREPLRCPGGLPVPGQGHPGLNERASDSSRPKSPVVLGGGSGVLGDNPGIGNRVCPVVRPCFRVVSG